MDRSGIAGMGEGKDVDRDVEGRQGQSVATGPPAIRLTTSGSPDPFGHWRESVCRTYTALTADRVGGGPFRGAIALTPVGDDASASAIVAGPQIVRRAARDIADRPCESIFVNLQVAGTARVRQRGAEALARPGDAFVLDARQPFAMRFDAPFRQVCLHLPLALLGGCGAEERMVARPLHRDAPAVDSLWRAGSELMAGHGAIGAAAALVAQAFGGGQADRLADEHLALIRTHVAARSNEPLDPPAVAARFRISVRHLHGLYARAGTTFGRELLRLRLERARDRLRARPCGEIAIIARESGFRSAAHFSRSFRAAYGMAPREWRDG